MVVIGPGSMGCLLAWTMARAGCDVRLLDHRPRRAELLRRNGITVETPTGTERVHVPITAYADELGIADLLLVCVKAYDTGAALERARAALGPDTCLATFQNGLGNVELLCEQAGTERTVCATLSSGATRVAPGHIRHGGAGTAWLAPAEKAGTAVAVRLGDLLRAAGIEAKVARDWRSVAWSKLVINAAVNPVTALYDIPNGALLEQSESRREALAAAREGEQVARAAGIRLLYADAGAELETVCRRTRVNLSSMLQDTRAGRRTEIEAISGALVEEADSREVPVPVNRSLLERLRRTERRGPL